MYIRGRAIDIDNRCLDFMGIFPPFRFLKIPSLGSANSTKVFVTSYQSSKYKVTTIVIVIILVLKLNYL